MTINRQIELLKIERECVQRNTDGRCNRDCANCELVQIDTELLEMYDEVIMNYQMALDEMIEEDRKKAEHNARMKKIAGKLKKLYYDNRDEFQEAMRYIKEDSTRKCGF